jgi:UDP-N-acetylmuramyl pentapeptide phosphotransferase/UDP-N-acetylglucosamine-1-phosphate transferase
MKGVAEEKIVIRFWIVAMFFLAIGFATLKLR